MKIRLACPSTSTFLGLGPRDNETQASLKTAGRDTSPLHDHLSPLPEYYPPLPAPPKKRKPTDHRHSLVISATASCPGINPLFR